MQDVGERDLVRRAQAGDQEAFTSLHASYAHRVFGLCRRLLGSGPDVEDAVNEVFLRMNHSLRKVDAERPLLPWLLTVASNHCMNVLRRRGLEQAHFVTPAPREQDVAAREPSPLAAIENDERLERLSQAMDALPDKLRVPLVLRYQRELSYQEIAAELGITRQNAAVLLYRAKQALRAAMEESR